MGREGTPKQREYLHGLLQAEHESRQESRRQRLLKSARLPALKSLTGFDYAGVRFPEDYGREALASLAKNQFLIIDEVGYLSTDTEGARFLFQVIADGYEKRSLIITTNLEFSRWGTVFGDDTMAAAVIDRIVHHGRLLQFRGESYRVKHALMK
ncbi:ATP-binding protein [Specibacter cremeus]|uniref:ATP-binding protein n=1 Tax=Specibacter cremeus TaxID=1629051 RepID=UPI0013DDF00E|nr:ATP-binding protein [Specibacter cremeus]